MATYQQYLGRFWLPATQLELNDGVNNPTLSIPAGYYYLTQDGADTDDQLVETVQAAMAASTGYSAATCAYSASTGLVTLTFASSTAVTWVDEELRDALGYTGNLSSGTTHAAPEVSRYVWRPSLPASYYPADLSQWWALGSTTKTGRRPDGKSFAVTGNTFGEARVQYTMLTEAEVVTDAAGSLRRFFEYVAHEGQPIRCYPDRTSGTTYTGLLASDGERLGTFSDFAARHTAGYQGRWDVELLLWEHTETEPQTIVTSQSTVWLYLDDTMPQGVAVDAEAVYQFDGSASALTDRTANGHDLTLQAGATFYVPVGGLLGLGFSTGEEYKAAYDAALKITGAITIEVVLYSMDIRTGVLVSCAAAGDTEAANELYQLYTITGTNKWKYNSESGAGTDNAITFDAMCPVGAVQYLALTRTTAGTSVSIYQDGELIDTAAVTAPTGGTSSRLTIGDDGDGDSAPWHGVVFSMRITAAEFTAAQVLEAYQRVRGIIV